MSSPENDIDEALRLDTRGRNDRYVCTVISGEFDDGFCSCLGPYRESE